MLQLYVPHVSQGAYGAKKAPNPSQVFGVFRLSIRIQERYLNEEFSRFGRVEKSQLYTTRGYGDFLCISLP
ncbi:hypothetical protein F4604DRAFT_1718692 [Suillus subluteus]|nr:hypothetical protein F4604DRAFT_1718692 [Suillus subluteus]